MRPLTPSVRMTLADYVHSAISDKELALTPTQVFTAPTEHKTDKDNISIIIMQYINGLLK